jgi:hypothetical protein
VLESLNPCAIGREARKYQKGQKILKNSSSSQFFATDAFIEGVDKDFYVSIFW